MMTDNECCELEDQGLGRHKGKYWAITDDRDRPRSLTQYENVTESMNDLYGEEDPSDWVDHRPDQEEPTHSDDE